MTDHTDDNQPTPEPEAPKVEPTPTNAHSKEAPPFDSNPAEVIQDLKEKATDAFKSGTADARESFEKTLPNIKEEFSKGIDDASYAIGYALSFGSTLVKELSPDNVTEGFERGSEAGARAADEVIENRKNVTPPPEDPDPSAA